MEAEVSTREGRTGLSPQDKTARVLGELVCVKHAVLLRVRVRHTASSGFSAHQKPRVGKHARGLPSLGRTLHPAAAGFA